MGKVMATAEHGPRYFLYGLVSVGVPSCGKFNVPAVYTNISHYLPWILDNIKLPWIFLENVKNEKKIPK